MNTMRLCFLFTMPWVASTLYARLTVVIAVTGSIFVATLIAPHGAAPANPYQFHVFALVLGFAIWSLWAGCLVANLQLSRNARDLCLPGIVRDAEISLRLFAVLSIALPTLVCWSLGANPWHSASIFVIAAASGLACMLLPMWLGISLTVAMFWWAVLDGLASPDAVRWILIAALLALDVWRWCRLRAVGVARTEGWSAPAVFYFHRPEAIRNYGWSNSSSLFLQARQAVPARISLHGIGPGRPVLSLRMALGGFGAPKPAASRLYDAGRVLAYVLFFSVCILAPQWLGPQHNLGNAEAIRTHWIYTLLVSGCLLACYVAVYSFAGRGRSLWYKPDAELPLLALLPGLGGPAQVKRHAVRALLSPAAMFLAIVAVTLCMGAFEAHAQSWAYVSIVLCCAGAFALITAIDLESLGGKPCHTAGYVLLCIGFLVLSFLILITSMPTDEYHGPHPERFGILWLWLLSLWGLYLFLLVVFALQGWQALRRRPHPFLANQP